MRRLLSILTLLTIIFSANAQNKISGSVEGIVNDSTGQPLEKAGVRLLHAQDSSLAFSQLTTIKGTFQISGIDSGRYLLLITYLGYKPFFKDVLISKKKQSYKLGQLRLSNTAVRLQGLTVAGKYIPLKISGDTLDYNADAFKTKPNAVVEDLLKKIPGIEVDPDGTIKSGGEEIEQILVDGKPFFGEDPKLATKNLPKGIIKRVQVYKKKSDQAEFTGVEDGDEKKTINLKIKKDKKHGLFGKAEAGAGTEDRFSTNLNLFRFNGDRQISFIGSGNNVNKRNYAYRGRSWSRSAGSGELNSWSGGVNYRDKWGEKIEVSGNYFYNYNDRKSIRDQNTQYILPDTTYYRKQDQNGRNKSINHRFNMKIEYELDSMNSFIFRPSINYNTGTQTSSSTFTTRDVDSNLVNEGSRDYVTQYESPNFSGSLLYRRRFHKKGRTFSLRLNGGTNNNDSHGKNIQENQLYDKTSQKDEDIDQHYTQNNDRKNWGARITYTEPLSETRTLELHVAHDANNTLSVKNTYNKDPLKGEYTDLDSTYSNNFKNTYQSNEAGFNIQTKKEKLRYTFGFNVKKNLLDNYSISGDSSLTQNTMNYFPSARLNYKFSNTKNLRINYRGNTGQPSISQLQPVPNNSESLRQMVGNPDLKPYFTHSIRFSYRNFDRESHHMLFADVSASTTMNQIVNATNYEEGGKQLIHYENTNGNYNLRGRVSVSLPISKEKTYNAIHSSTSVRYSKNSSFINDKQNFSSRLTLSERLQLNFSIEELLEMSVGGDIGYNKTVYTLQRSQNNSYFNYGGNLNLNLQLPWDLELETDLRYSDNSGLSAGYNQSVANWNASISKYLFKKQQGEIRLAGYDLLNQRTNISRNITSESISDVRTNELPQYFLLSFIYHIKIFPGGSQDGERSRPRPHMRYRRYH